MRDYFFFFLFSLTPMVLRGKTLHTKTNDVSHKRYISPVIPCERFCVEAPGVRFIKHLVLWKLPNSRAWTPFHSRTFTSVWQWVDGIQMFCSCSLVEQSGTPFPPPRCAEQSFPLGGSTSQALWASGALENSFSPRIGWGRKAHR